jgi:hypothetical protein
MRHKYAYCVPGDKAGQQQAPVGGEAGRGSYSGFARTAGAGRNHPAALSAISAAFFWAGAASLPAID